MRHLAPALLLLAAAAAAGACAGRERPDTPPPGPAPGPPLPRSSVAAVLLRAEALGLDAAQVDALQAIDADLTARLAARAPPPPREPGARAQPAGIAESRGGAGGGGAPPGGGRGGPAGGPGMGGGGPPGAGAGGPPGGAGGPTEAERIAALEAALDDEDTRAFLRAEAVLRPEQREAARELASEFRAARYDRRRERRPGRR